MIALLSRLSTKPAAPRRRPPRPPLPEIEEAADDALPRGCGWFDSSHELRAGLVVTEHARPGAVAEQMPLDDWLQLYLQVAAGGWRAGPPP